MYIRVYVCVCVYVCIPSTSSMVNGSPAFQATAAKHLIGRPIVLLDDIFLFCTKIKKKKKKKEKQVEKQFKNKMQYKKSWTTKQNKKKEWEKKRKAKQLTGWNLSQLDLT